MARYRVELTTRAQRDLRDLPNDVLKRAQAAIDSLAENPRPPGVKKLKTWGAGMWRIRLGHYRVLYQFQAPESLVVVVRISHRRDVYR